MKKRIFTRSRLVRIAFAVGGLLIISIGAYMCHPQVGAVPWHNNLSRIRQSANWENGQFQNESATPTFAPGHHFAAELWESLFGRYPRKRPECKIPTVKVDLLHLPTDAEVLVWFGHSSCFFKSGGKTFLIDPVLSGSISPIPTGGKAFDGTDVYQTTDLPFIDYLLISHDHFDHLDYRTVSALRHRTGKVICGLGVGAHFERWGYAPGQITEMDWNDSLVVDTLTIHTLPARHKSGRSIQQNRSLWVSFLIQTPTRKIFYSGDGGYDKHFLQIGRKFGPVDLAIMENGQYDSAWHYVHMLPEEAVHAAQDLQAKRLLPVHHSKFALARHPWKEPLERITELSRDLKIPLLTPRIGEPVMLNDSSRHWQRWWEAVRELIT